ncbi:MAG: cytochrome b/b6 domain-containing protein [Granulosicoccus sp.]
MQQAAERRYGDVAVIFHWLIAFFIIGLVVVGKYMVGLEPNDPVRFELTQWHKSFGLTVLLLSVLRLVWRFTHRPPPDPDSVPQWQQRIAATVHVLLYGLLFVIPITGWIMSSASPLNIDTVLFNVITIPHLPPFADLPNKAQIAESFHEYHELAGNLLILLLLAHVGAALKHHFIDKDTILVRMLPNWASNAFKGKLTVLGILIVSASTTLYLYAGTSNEAALLAAGESEVSFIADVTGDQTPGSFADSTVTASINTQAPDNSSIVAVVNTSTLSSENAQVEGSLPDPEWFDVAAYPEARFDSTAITANADGTFQVDGNLTIKANTQTISFPMSLTDEDDKQVARGEFTIDRREFNIGMDSQPTDEYVGFNVTIRFRFDISQTVES